MKDRRTYTKELSRERTDAYIKGDERVRRGIEGKSDPFDLAALEGWKAAGNMNAMRGPDSRFLKKQWIGGYLAAAVVIVGGAIAALLFIPGGEKRQAVPEKEIVLNVEHSDIVIEPEIRSMETLPVARQISPAAVKSDQKQLESLPASAPEVNVAEIPQVILPAREIDQQPKEQKASNQKAAKEVYYHDLKMIDYRSYRSKPVIPTEQIILTGTPANREININEEEPVSKMIDIPYADFLEKTAKFIGKGKWKEALQRLGKIVETYPDDVNGHFYAGLCYYNLQQYPAAQEHFSKCLQLPFSNFNEEATWYLALSLNANGEKAKARELCIIIRDSKGYYAKQAEKLLKDLK
jgi:tetratricopeptide (TPR) repeat protein